MRTDTPGRSRRRGAALAACAVAASAALGLAGCGDDSGAAGTTTAATAPAATATAPVDADRAYVEQLRAATRSMADVAGAILDPAAQAGERGSRIEVALVELEEASGALEAIALDDSELDAQRRDLVEAIPPFATAMRAVVAAGEEDPVNGGLELVQRREPILAGVDATLAADAGAIRALGETARAALVEARDALQRELGELRAQAAG
jgi:hypothetical protein